MALRAAAPYYKDDGDVKRALILRMVRVALYDEGTAPKKGECVHVHGIESLLRKPGFNSALLKALYEGWWSLRG